MSKNFDRIIQFFQETNWNFSQLSGKTILRTRIKSNNGEWDCLAQLRDEQEQFNFYSVFLEKAPENRLLSVAEFLMRANEGLLFGKFAVNLEDGGLHYETSVNFKGDRLSLPLITNVIHHNIFMMNRYLPGIVSVLRGSISPEEAISQIRE